MSKADGDGTAQKVSVLDALHLLAQAWSMVQKATVVTCFRKAFFSLNDENEETLDCLVKVHVHLDKSRPSSVDSR